MRHTPFKFFSRHLNLKILLRHHHCCLRKVCFNLFNKSVWTWQCFWNVKTIYLISAFAVVKHFTLTFALNRELLVYFLAVSLHVGFQFFFFLHPALFLGVGTEASAVFKGSFTPERAEVSCCWGWVEAVWQRNHVITVGPVRPVFSWSWETFRAMSTRGASITCNKEPHKHNERMTSCMDHPALLTSSNAFS